MQKLLIRSIAYFFASFLIASVSVQGASTAERTEIIQMVVGVVGAAPGADILAELEDIFDSGLTIEEIAIAISENPAFSGDTGLFPDFLPNAIFAENFMTQLLGDEVTADSLNAAIDELTESLNAGDSRGQAMYSTIVSLAATTDPNFADAKAALANKTEVAEYYSVDVALSSLDLDDLLAVLDGVDSSDTAVADGTRAIDDNIANANPNLIVSGGISTDGFTYQQSATVNVGDTIQIHLPFMPRPEHIGLSAGIVVAIEDKNTGVVSLFNGADGLFYTFDAANPAIFKTVTLTNETSVDVANNFTITQAEVGLEINVNVGYVVDGIIYFGNEPVSLTVK